MRSLKRAGYLAREGVVELELMSPWFKSDKSSRIPQEEVRPAQTLLVVPVVTGFCLGGFISLKVSKGFSICLCYVCYHIDRLIQMVHFVTKKAKFLTKTLCDRFRSQVGLPCIHYTSQSNEHCSLP